MADQQPPHEGHEGHDDPMGDFDRTVIVHLDHFFANADENGQGQGRGHTHTHTHERHSDDGSNQENGDGVDERSERNPEGVGGVHTTHHTPLTDIPERRDSPFPRPLIPVQILLSSFMAALRARNGGGGGVAGVDGANGGAGANANANTNGNANGGPPELTGMGFRIERSPLPAEHPLRQHLSHLRGQEGHGSDTAHSPHPNYTQTQNGGGEMGERSSLLERIEELHSRNPYGENASRLPPPFTITINFPIAGGLHSEKKADPARAETILGALPKLHKGVTRRMSRVGVETTCGVCLDSLNAKAPLQKAENSAGAEGGENRENRESGTSETNTTCSTPSPEDEAKREEEIVALPCSHVFHSNCLRPWFALHTLCPMCRFDLDPESMTMSTPPPEERGREGEDNPFVSIIERLVRGNRERAPAPEETNNGGRAESAAASGRSSRHHPYARVRSAGEGGSRDSRPARNTRSATAAAATAASLDETHTQTQTHSHSHTQRPPPPPKKFEIPKAGRSLEDILIKRERENGLRCDMKECKLGPTDESERLETADMLSIGGAEKPVCSHFLHSHCYHLANGNCRYYNPAHTHQDGCVLSRCPICKTIGSVEKHELVH
ncbi:E3 ubiquitin-protein ligase [Wallemia ichthyophaga EXF-994]|uniref:E3 ubiquitin-protein ligase n=1 Tax=Wallemia ichthyophaga (strain EXF-994 / CBS 113033) TaxID=1299270 RepID=R9A941_WALI9|nr:E3 ubiquitin-protein ligase [Wallemia ichthyophaga EXF-994]EOQ98681.1 E3 ubiquitin-protein ligase [Wallemia ichthyophaga EXF-994]TIB35657.1 hypothetical protein E3P84_01331 [Wallemia ichthyophaga]TIB42624.1 hypothetical protein E3P83_01100 [Wallemia ichthyophaga]